MNNDLQQTVELWDNFHLPVQKKTGLLCIQRRRESMIAKKNNGSEK